MNDDLTRAEAHRLYQFCAELATNYKHKKARAALSIGELCADETLISHRRDDDDIEAMRELAGALEKCAKALREQIALDTATPNDD